MKTEQKLEVYRELFGSLPEVPAGKELVSVDYRLAQLGEYAYDGINGWELSEHSYESFKLPVAIFKDTHRADGTPLSIDPLPEVGGYRVEYSGLGVVGDGEFDGYAFFNLNDNKPKWRVKHRQQIVQKYAHNHYARLFKIAQPTTLADLVGKHGQKVVWLHAEDGCLTQAIIAGTPCQPLTLRGADEKWHEVVDLMDSRWSNNPFTTWANANEFVPEK